MNVLLVTLDQFRGDCLSAAGHPVVQTPTLDALAAEGTRLSSHYASAAPCSPGRASLYTGTYQANHRVIANGTPLDDSFDNVARMARRAGYRPVLFGYTDQGIDPLRTTGETDPRLDTYEGILPGFDPVLSLDSGLTPWLSWLDDLGYGSMSADSALASEPERPCEHGLSGFMTDRMLRWIDHQSEPWFLHASYLRPHPPYAAAGRWSRRYRPDELPDPIAAAADLHPMHRMALGRPAWAAPPDPATMAVVQAQYLGMISEVDHQLGRLFEHLRRRCLWEETLVVLTSDHGEQMGDHGLIQKLGFFEQSYHIPCIIRPPAGAWARGRTVEDMTEAVDVFPTMAELMGQDPPVQCDGRSLVPFLDGGSPVNWRRAAHWEWDWSHLFMGPRRAGGVPDPGLERCNLAVERSSTHAYVHFGDSSSLCFDLAADPSWRTTTTASEVVLPMAQSLLTWRSNHLGARYSRMLLGPDRRGLWPALGRD